MFIMLRKVSVRSSLNLVKLNHTESFAEPDNRPKGHDEQLRLMFPDVPSFSCCSGATRCLMFSAPITTASPLVTPFSNPRVVIEHDSVKAKKTICSFS